MSEKKILNNDIVSVSTGKLGIGTTDPSEKLHVADTTTGILFRLQNTEQGEETSMRFMGRNTSTAYKYADIALDPEDHSLIFRVPHTSERMRIKAGGNVGIGTSSPIGTLEVQAASSIDGTQLTIANDYGESSKVLAFNNDADQVGNLTVYGRPSTGGDGPYMSFGLSNGTDVVERLHIAKNGTIRFNSYGAGFLQTDANGNITAGTVTTSDTLDDVTDNGNTTTNTITVGGVTTGGVISTGDNEFQGDTYLKNGGDDGAGTRVGDIWYSVSTGGGAAPVGVYESAVITTVKNGTHGRSDIVFQTKDNDTANFGSTSERMRILKDGRIGINASNPLYGRLQVTQSANNDESGIGVLSASANRSVRLWVDETVSYLSSGDSGAGILSLNPGGGNVGIGKSNPASLLHLGYDSNSTNIISFGDATIGGPHGLDFYGDDATRTKKFSIYYRTGTENISMEDGGGTKRWEITQSGAVTFNQAFTFPTADGGAGSALITDGSGALSWNAGYKQYSPVGWTVLNNQTYTSTGANISSSSTQAQAGTTPVQRNSATEFEATKQGWYEISYSFLVKNNYTNRAMVGAYMTVSTSGGGGVVPGSHSTQYVRYNTYGEYAQIQNTFYYYTAYASTNFYLVAYLLSGSMNMTTQSVNQSMISFRYINNDIT